MDGHAPTPDSTRTWLSPSLPMHVAGAECWEAGRNPSYVVVVVAVVVALAVYQFRVLKSDVVVLGRMLSGGTLCLSRRRRCAPLPVGVSLWKAHDRAEERRAPMHMPRDERQFGGGGGSKWSSLRGCRAWRDMVGTDMGGGVLDRLCSCCVMSTIGRFGRFFTRPLARSGNQWAPNVLMLRNPSSQILAALY